MEHPEIRFWISGRLIMSGDLKKSQHRKASANLFSTFPNGYRLHIKSVTACAGRVVLEARGEGELADGTMYSPDYCMVFELAGGLITAMREYIDTEYVSAHLLRPPEGRLMETVTLTDADDGIAVLTLDRPERLNAINLLMYEELEDALARLAADRSLRAVILTGSGRGFCSGQDLKDLGADQEGSGLGRVQFGMAWQARAAALVQRIHALPQPVIAAVNGAASGAGLSIALAADTRIAATSAKFNAAFVRIGLSGGDMGASYFLPRIVGPTAATEILFTGRMVLAEEAHRIGLVLRVVDDDRLLDEALDIARMIRTNSPFGVAMTKEVLWHNIDAPSLDAAIALENRTQILASITEDADEALAAFMAKRDPKFRNH